LLRKKGGYEAEEEKKSKLNPKLSIKMTTMMDVTFARRWDT